MSRRWSDAIWWAVMVTSFALGFIFGLQWWVPVAWVVLVLIAILATFPHDERTPEHIREMWWGQGLDP